MTESESESFSVMLDSLRQNTCIRYVPLFSCFPICHEMMGPDAMILVF